jgi:hypothetical protein
MTEDDSAQPTMRLLAATVATHDAFAEAARVVAGRGHASEFARRAEYQGRIATHLRGHQAPEGLASDALRQIPDVWRDSSAPSAAADGDPRELFDRCLRLMDAATMEFCRGYGPNVALVLSSAMQVAYPINTTRHGKGVSGAKESAPGACSRGLERTN